MIKKRQQFIPTLCIFILSAILLFSGCNQQNEKEEVEKAMTTFFSAYKKDSYREIDRRLFSDKLATLLDQATEREKEEVQIVLDSDYPTDKPFMLDFDIFTSMVEGVDSIRVLQISIIADTARVNVSFANTLYNNTIEWNDQLILIKEKDWKLENVLYGEENMEFKSLQDLLVNYIHADNVF